MLWGNVWSVSLAYRFPAVTFHNEDYRDKYRRALFKHITKYTALVNPAEIDALIASSLGLAYSEQGRRGAPGGRDRETEAAAGRRSSRYHHKQGSVGGCGGDG